MTATIKKVVISQNDSADVRGLDDAGKEIFWTNTHHSLRELMALAQANGFLDAPYSVQIVNPKPVIVPVPTPTTTVPPSWEAFVSAVSKFTFPYPWMAELLVSQAILESGHGTSPLSKYRNLNGMKYRLELEKFGGKKYKYVTNSEPFRDVNGHEVPEGTSGAERWDYFFAFDTYEQAIITWVNFWQRSPYPKVIAKDMAVLKDMESFLTYVGPIYCPYFTTSHSESYASYIISKCLPEAKKLLGSPAPTPTPVPNTVVDNAKKFIDYFSQHYADVRAEVERWFVGKYSPTAVSNGCVAHQVSCLKLCGFNYPQPLGSMESINVDYFVTWALGQKWTKITDVTKLQHGDICVSGPSSTDIDHVYAFLSYIDKDTANVCHNQAVGVSSRSLAGVGCGKWRFALRMPGTAASTNPTPVPSPDTTPGKKWNIKGKGVLLNNGHSSRGNGAFSTNGVVAEYDLNLLQANTIKAALDKVGIPCRILNQNEAGGLTETGDQAEGYDIFLILHHNATVGAQGACYLLGDKPKAGSKKFGELVTDRIAAALGITDRGYNTRVVSVTKAADATSCPVVVLIESYFIDSMPDYNKANSWSIAAANVMVNTIMEWLA